MRHEAAYERRASLWEDLGIGVAVAAMAAAVVIGIGLWYSLRHRRDLHPGHRDPRVAQRLPAGAGHAPSSAPRPSARSSTRSTPTRRSSTCRCALVVDRGRLARRVVAVRQPVSIARAAADRAVTPAREREFPPADRRAGVGLRVSRPHRARRPDRDRFGDERPAGRCSAIRSRICRAVPASR